MTTDESGTSRHGDEEIEDIDPAEGGADEPGTEDGRQD